MTTASYQFEWKIAGVWTGVASASVLSLSSGSEAGLSDNGVGFGDQTSTRADVTVLRTETAGITLPRLLVRITYTIDAGSAVAFQGIVTGYSGDRETIKLTCEGLIADLPARTKSIYTKLRHKRAPATKTTASSIEDPTNGSYVGGVINEVLWKAGGRPNEQSGTYTTADFYYSCDQAIRAPDWSWVAGEDGWSECLRLARAVGGQLYQGLDGVVRYKQPLSMVGSVGRTFTTADYADLQEDVDTGQYATRIVASFTPRYQAAIQEVISDTTYRTVPAGASLTVDLEPHWPIVDSSWVLDGGTLKDKNIIATFFDGALAAYHASTGFTVVVTTYAMRLTIVITNNTSRNMQISKITVAGAPVVAGETQTVVIGSADPTRNLEDNIFVQSKAHATALASMAYTYYGTVRPVRRLSGCVWDVSRTVGETVELTDSALSLSATNHLILSVSDSEAGAVAEYALVDATGLPTTSQYWLVQSTSQSGTKKVGW